MAEASLFFPTCCLALSFCFVFFFYNASIKDRIDALQRNVVIPAYQWIAFRVFNQSIEVVPNSPVSDQSYEAIDFDERSGSEQSEHFDEESDYSEEARQPSPERPWFFPRSQSASRESPGMESEEATGSSPEAHNFAPEPRNAGPNTVFFANYRLEQNDEDGTFALAPVPASVGSDSDSENPDPNIVMAYQERRGPDDLPNMWQWELNQPVYVINEPLGAIQFEQMINWSVQAAFTLVAPPLVVETMVDTMLEDFEAPERPESPERYPQEQ
jgi:hypothetical protein